ncbi:hypothetical protein E2C01_087576 [Portunus trituberculatus]|uniref:Uncharacterized protein n=1 Tax=Portunus trituberculatus TaxID=210409 RepID=A0A5B7JCV0_PORTR|nr:hypothetical protein [Portunus trituberculatus]
MPFLTSDRGQRIRTCGLENSVAHKARVVTLHHGGPLLFHVSHL